MCVCVCVCVRLVEVCVYVGGGGGFALEVGWSVCSRELEQNKNGLICWYLVCLPVVRGCG